MSDEHLNNLFQEISDHVDGYMDEIERLNKYINKLRDGGIKRIAELEAEREGKVLVHKDLLAEVLDIANDNPIGQSPKQEAAVAELMCILMCKPTLDAKGDSDD